MKSIDNVNIRLVDELKPEIKKGAKLSIAASAFSIYAFQELKKELENIDELRFIFTSPTFITDNTEKKESREFYIPHIYNEQHLCGGEFEIRLKNQLNQRAIASECAAWIKTKVRFKSNKSANRPLIGFIHVTPESVYTPVNNFSTTGLGTTPYDGFPILTNKLDAPFSRQYLDMFNQIWNDKTNLEDVTDKVVAYFESTYKENSPEYIYFVTLYNIFNEFLTDLSLENMPDNGTGFKDSVIWSKLYNFQQDATIGTINKLEKYNGCILADSVGLGKTFTALAVIKYYEKRNKDVLVLCPKKLEANWNTYCNNDKNNPFISDKFRYDVLFHTDLSRDKGISNGRDLANVNWGNYGLIVIDESHNFRNNNTVVGKENRYQRLLRKVIKEGIDTKVLMLSATPVNNRFNDLKNQLALAYQGVPQNIDDKLNTSRGIEEIFKRAQKEFNSWAKLPSEKRNADSLLEKLDFDFFELLDSLTIARSRKHITTYYDTTAIGKFPTRNKPESQYVPLTDSDLITYENVAQQLLMLNLAVYSPIGYVLPGKLHVYEEKYDQKVNSSIFTQQDRERSLKTLVRINLLKRIESSLDSFTFTLQGIIDQINHSLSLMKDQSSTAIESSCISDDELSDMDADTEENADGYTIGKKIKVRLADMDRIRWKEDLTADKFILETLLCQIKKVSNTEDKKLKRLKQLISDKIEHPVNAGNKKIIVFTAFADTADYLYRSLNEWFLTKYGLYSALITGNKRYSNAKGIKTDLNSLLTCFSPRSKDKALTMPDIQLEIDLLVATDCISEGQNLQDCDYLINYDIHWNPVRIIQRFGRIDRIGSINESVTMVNFWPDISLDAYINLKQKVETKMTITNMTSTGDDNVLNTAEKDLEYRKAQLKKLQDEVIDLEDVKEGITITDLGLNDFRIDLSNLVKQYGKLKNVPLGLHAVTETTNGVEKGVIFILRNINNEINIDKQNRLHPYYLIYVAQDGTIRHDYIQSKKILDILRLLCKGKQEPLMDLCLTFNKETKNCQNMTFYSKLLENSIKSILKTEDQKEVLSLFKSGGTASKNKMKGMEDFSLVSFIIIK